MGKHDGSTLDSLLDELDDLAEGHARAAKKILAVQAERRMKELGLSTTALASQMGTNRKQIRRILAADDAGDHPADAVQAGRRARPDAHHRAWPGRGVGRKGWPRAVESGCGGSSGRYGHVTSRDGVAGGASVVAPSGTHGRFCRVCVAQACAHMCRQAAGRPRTLALPDGGSAASPLRPKRR